MERTENLNAYWKEYRQKLNDLFDQVNIDDVSKVLTIMIDAWKHAIPCMCAAMEAVRLPLRTCKLIFAILSVTLVNSIPAL